MVQDYVWIFFFGLGPLSLSSSVSHGRDIDGVGNSIIGNRERATSERRKEERKKERVVRSTSHARRKA